MAMLNNQRVYMYMYIYIYIYKYLWPQDATSGCYIYRYIYIPSFQTHTHGQDFTQETQDPGGHRFKVVNRL